MLRLAVLSPFFVREGHSRCLLAVHMVIKVVEVGLWKTHLESIGESQTSNTTTSNDDFQIVCHDLGTADKIYELDRYEQRSSICIEVKKGSERSKI